MNPEVLPDLGQLAQPAGVPDQPRFRLAVDVAPELDPVAQVDGQI